MTDFILGVPVGVTYTWHCSECNSTFNDHTLRELQERAHVHFQQQHGPLEGQGEFPMTVGRRMQVNPT